MPRTRATTAREAGGVEELEEDSGWEMERNGNLGRIVDVVTSHRKVKLDGRTGLGPETAANIDLNYANLRFVIHNQLHTVRRALADRSQLVRPSFETLILSPQALRG